MSNYANRLIDRHTGKAAALLQPRIASRYEAGPQMCDSPLLTGVSPAPIYESAQPTASSRIPSPDLSNPSEIPLTDHHASVGPTSNPFEHFGSRLDELQRSIRGMSQPTLTPASLSSPVPQQSTQTQIFSTQNHQAVHQDFHHSHKHEHLHFPAESQKQLAIDFASEKSDKADAQYPTLLVQQDTSIPKHAAINTSRVPPIAETRKSPDHPLPRIHVEKILKSPDATTVSVSIGRIEVRSTPAKAMNATTQSPVAKSVMGLDEYVRLRQGGQR